MENLFEKLPEKFVERLKNSLSLRDFVAYKVAICKKPVRGVRINHSKAGGGFENDYRNVLKRLPFCDDGFLFMSDEKLGNSVYHLTGEIYLQEPSSMLAVCASEIEKETKNLKVLDLCASPGGKSGQIASRISENSILFSNEIIRQRAQVLFSNIERQGFKNVVVLNEEPQNLLAFEGYFDYVFVDAPCSGEGMFRKNPETIGEWSAENVEMCAARQREILEVATRLVAPGGKLVYSTCTFAENEDENIVEWLAGEKNFELLNVSDEVKAVTLPSKAKCKNGDFARKFFPFSGDGEGQFVAVLKNNGQNEHKTVRRKKHFDSIFEIGRNNLNFAREFFEKSTNLADLQTLIEVGNNVYLPPRAFDSEIQTILDSLKFVSVGVRAGTIEKGRFEPHHNLFMACHEEFKIKIELDDENLKKYLHGEEVMSDIAPLNAGNYAVLTKNGNPVGGGKIAGGRVKNLYPKGMRV